MNNWKLRHSFTGNATSDVQTVNGYLADPAYHLTTNVLPDSQDFTQWQNLSGATLTPNAATAPDGTTTATSWDSPTFAYRILRTVPQTLSASTNYVFSFYAKNIDADGAAYRVYNNTAASDVVAATSYISEINTSDWTRIEVQFTTGATPTDAYTCYVGSVGFSGEILFWGAQLEEGDTATSYVPTNGEPVTLPDTFNVTVVPDGKEYAAPLFIPRTNLLTYSNEFDNTAWNSFTEGLTRTASSITDPDGGTNAWEITTTATTNLHRMGHVITAGTIKTLSFYAKANGYEYVRVWSFSGGNTKSNYFHLSGEGTAYVNAGQYGIVSIESVGNGWYRCQAVLDPVNSLAVVISPAPDASTASFTNTYLADGTSGIYLYEAQLEAGTVATEYIPTTTAAVTRDWSAFGRVQNQLLGISNGTHTHTGAASGSGIAATTITGSGSGATFAYDFDTLGVLTTLTADGAGSGYKVGDKLSIDTTEGHTIEFRLVEGSNAATVSVSMGAAKPNKPIPFPVSKMRVEGLTDRTVLFLDERSRYVFPKPTPYLLDTYEGAAAAYSLRRLRSSYTGPAVRVRRASNNDELDIYFNRDGSLDTATLEAFCAGTDGFVKVWFDQGQGGNDATQTTTADQPQIVSSGSVVTENGKPAVQFDGSDDSFIANALAGLSRLDLFFATQTSDTQYVHFAELSSIVDRGFTANKLDSGSGLPANMGTPTMYNNGTQFTGTTRDDVQTAQDGHQIISYIDANTTAFATFEIGGHGAYTFNGKFQELIAYDSDQSTNRTGIESNINEHYGIYEFSGLLDDYSGAAAAYSLRRLSSTYTGPAIRVVKHDVGYPEMDIPFEDDGTLSVVLLEAFADGYDATVKVWYDQSGSSFNATEDTVANQPKIYDSDDGVVMIDGNPALSFDGVDDQFYANHDDLLNQSRVDYFAHYQTTDGVFMLFSDYPSRYSWAVHNFSTDTVLTTITPTPDLYINGAQVAITNGVTTRDDLHTSIVTNAASAAAGALESTIDANTMSWETFGFSTYLSIRRFYGKLAEVILYNSDQSSNRTGIESNINDFYSIYP